MATTKRIYIIDLYRFFAAVYVMLFHYAYRGSLSGNYTQMSSPFLIPFAKYGYLGVELFFVISGFVVLMSAWNSDFTGYVASRVGRLYPAFWVGCTFTLVVILLIGNPASVTLPQYLINMSMLGGFFGVPYIDGVYWTLLVEMKFYILIALLVLIRQIKKIEWFAFLWLFASMITVFFGSTSKFILFKIARYFLVVEHAPLFISGILFFLVWKNGLTVMRSIGIVVSCVYSVYLSVDTAIADNIRVNLNVNIWVVGAIIVIIYLVFALTALGFININERPIYTTLGSLTYPLYLVHQIAGYLIFNLLMPYVNKQLLFWATILFMIGLAWLIYTYVEKKGCPLLRKRTDNLLRNKLKLNW